MQALPSLEPQPESLGGPADSLISVGFSFVKEMRRKVSTGALPDWREKAILYGSYLETNDEP
jgi:hypothetical protein